MISNRVLQHRIMLPSIEFLPLPLIFPSSLFGDHVSIRSTGAKPRGCHLILNPLTIKRNTGEDPH